MLEECIQIRLDTYTDFDFGKVSDLGQLTN